MALNAKSLDKVREDLPVAEVTRPSLSEYVRVNLQVERAKRNKWHTDAINSGITLTELINRAMDAYRP